jgi:hypothetical protein
MHGNAIKIKVYAVLFIRGFAMTFATYAGVSKVVTNRDRFHWVLKIKNANRTVEYYI